MPSPQPCFKTFTHCNHARLGEEAALQDRLGDPYPGYSRGCESTVVTNPAIHTRLCGCGTGSQELPLWMAEVEALVELQGGAGRASRARLVGISELFSSTGPAEVVQDGSQKFSRSR